MARNKKKRKAVKQAQVAEKDEHQRPEESRKIETYLVTLPSAVKKFVNISDMKNSDPSYNDSSEGPFGLGSVVFPCLQRFNNIEVFLFLCFLAIFVHGIMFALVDVSLKLFVSRFLPSDTEIFLLDFSDYFASFLVAMLVAVFGSRGNRAKWVAAACFVTGLSAIVFAVIYFNYEIIKVSTVESEDLCEEGKTPKVCGVTVIPHKSICIFLFIFGQFLHGLAGMPLFILGTTFIYDHAPTFTNGIYIAIEFSGVTLGYILGFLVGTRIVLPVKEAMKAVDHVQRLRILQRNWWKSFIFVGSASFSTSLLLFCFPSSLPGAQKLRLQKSKEPPTSDRRLQNKEIKHNLKGILHAIWCLLRNPLVLTQTFCKVTESLTFKASSHFLPLYLQTQFLITPNHSIMMTGMFIFPAYTVGRFFGGYIVDKLQMNNKTKMKFISVVSIVSVGLFLPIIFVQCETAKFEGINDDYDGLGRVGNLTAPCNENCGCTTSAYTPLCGRDERQYFSPCFAGCRASKYLRNEKAYYNCSCIKEGLASPDDEGQYIDAISGTCNINCLTLPLFFAFYFCATVFSNFCNIPALMIIMESVPASWNSMSLGVTYTIWRFIGAFLVTTLFPEASALCCNFWDINECGVKIRCWIYNSKRLVYVFMGIWISMQVSAFLLCLYGIFRHDYTVNGKTKSLDTPVNGGKTKHEKKKQEQLERVVKEIK
ncbi:solute carrier organic anion transporter family member 6A1-like [Grammomys surdaster]|uniref:solute carrier organic anion transporter family member 6A1-like n=1 Tax=Grammomys surdaster TaxID=491861 RepID=UPI00109FC06C|nr:solute carrier organic anion transporter family member 6A1-like [Grammomys surdaster]